MHPRIKPTDFFLLWQYYLFSLIDRDIAASNEDPKFLNAIQSMCVSIHQ